MDGIKEDKGGQVVVGYYMSPEGQTIPLMADAKYYPNGVPQSPFITPMTASMPAAETASMPAAETRQKETKIMPPPIPVQQPGPMAPPSQPVQQPGLMTAPVQQPGPMAPPIQPMISPAYGSLPPSYAANQPVRTRAVPPKAPRPERNLENVVGKNLMGILASILIFIGMILFATVAYETFSDVARVAFIYFVSALILAIGLIGMHKNRNAFNLSLAGCGVGAVYISMFLTYGYFELINGITLYIMLALWSVVVFFLGGKGSLLFKTIGQGGVLISAFYGTIMQYMEPGSQGMLSFTVVLIVYYILITVFYLLMDSKPGAKENLPFLIMDFLGAPVLLAASVNIKDEVGLAVQILLACVILAYTLFLLFLYLRRIDKPSGSADAAAGWTVFALVQSIFAALTVTCLIGNDKADGSDWIRGCIAILNYAILWFMTEYKRRRDEARILALVFIYVFLVIYSGSFGIVSDILGVGALALVFLPLGFFKKDKLYYALGCAGSMLYVFLMDEYPAVYSIFSILFVLLILFFMLYGSQIYHSVFKLLAYGMLQVFLLRLIYILPDYTVLSRAIWENAVYFASVLLCIFATHSPFSRNWNGTGEREKATLLSLGILNILLMLWSLEVLNLKNGEVMHFITVLVFLAACCQNIMPMVKNFGKTMWTGIYTGVKLTIFLHAMLWSYEIESYIVSLASLVLALAFITFGFMRNYKPIRLYGLILSLASIFKLVLIDVTYDSTITRALTIMGCGVLAFIISFVYNRISKKMEDEIKNEA